MVRKVSIKVSIKAVPNMGEKAGIIIWPLRSPPISQLTHSVPYSL